MISHNGNVLRLRPSLRAAATLEARYGFPALYKALDEFNLTIISEIIRATVIRADDAAFLSVLAGKPLFPFFLAVQQPLFQLLELFAPAPDPKAKPSTGKGKPITWQALYKALYDQATGALGWTPDQAWNATPTEIDRAYAAHIEHLVRIGTLIRDKDNEPDHDPQEEVTEQEVRTGLDKLRKHTGK